MDAPIASQQNHTKKEEGEENGDSHEVLKRKYYALVLEMYKLTDELHKSKRKVRRLLKEKSFLLDKLVEFEYPSVRGVTEEDVLAEEDDSYQDPGLDDEEFHPHKKRRNVMGKSKAQESQQMCAASGKGDKACKSKALIGYQYCWHHAPLDPNSPYVYCQYKKGNKSCNIPVAKKNGNALCNYHKKLEDMGDAADMLPPDL